MNGITEYFQDDLYETVNLVSLLVLSSQMKQF